MTKAISVEFDNLIFENVAFEGVVTATLDMEEEGTTYHADMKWTEPGRYISIEDLSIDNIDYTAYDPETGDEIIPSKKAVDKLQDYFDDSEFWYDYIN